MVFIVLLILTTTFIAGAAAFFSVYGLAATFSGTFWSVVLMGASLECGKLIAASYLYRYWTTTNLWLKSYLMAGILALMVLTSTGIFGYLSSGYQTDVLPLKQIEEQVKVLDEEKARLIQRKNQIDVQISQLPSNSVRGRTALIKGFKDEQAAVTLRIGELDKVILEQKTKLIQTQAHIGPITYIASAFGLDTDNATKYLIYLIIFAFDPMAVSLTLAVNIAIRLRREEQEAEKVAKHEERVREMQIEHEERLLAERFAKEEAAEVTAPVPVAVTEDFVDHFNRPGRETLVKTLPEWPVAETPLEPPVIVKENPFTDEELALMYPPFKEPVIEEPVVEEVPAEEPETIEELERPGDYIQEEEPVAQPEPIEPLPSTHRRVRPYGAINVQLSDAKLNELVQHYSWLKKKNASGEALSQDDRWELSAIEEILRKNGLGMYVG